MHTSIPGRTRGMAAAEFMLIAIPLLLTGLGAYEAARWQLTRQAVSLALLEGARAGAVANGSPAAIQAALQRGLLPLAGGEGPRQARARQQAAAAVTQATYGLPPWQVRVLSPRRAHFDDFAVSTTAGRRVIDNDYQHEQHARAIANGYPQGRGPASEATIFAANTLTLEIRYLHAPIVPGLGNLLRQLGRTLDADTFGGRAMRHAGRLPVRQTVAIAMQSAPHEWPAFDQAITPAPLASVNLPAGTHASSGAPPGPLRPAPDIPCIGLWCGAQLPLRPAAADPADTLPPPSSAWSATAVPDTDPACGVVLCCS